MFLHNSKHFAVSSRIASLSHRVARHRGARHRGESSFEKSKTTPQISTQTSRSPLAKNFSLQQNFLCLFLQPSRNRRKIKLFDSRKNWEAHRAECKNFSITSAATRGERQQKKIQFTYDRECSKYVNFPLLKSGGGDEGSEKLDNNERLLSHLVTVMLLMGATGSTCGRSPRRYEVFIRILTITQVDATTISFQSPDFSHHRCLQIF